NQNGLWKADSDYTVNISQPGYFYTTTRSVGTHTYPPGSHIYIADNVTVTFAGTMHLNNAEVKLCKDARIEVREGGKLITNGTTFKRLNASDQHDGIRLYIGGNQIKNTTIEGGYYGLYMSSSNNNVIDKTTFENNGTGVYVAPGVAITLQGVTFTNNNRGIWTYGDVYVEDFFNGWNSGFTPSSFFNNSIGVKVSGHGRFYNSRSRYSSNGHAVQIYNNGRYHPQQYHAGNAFYGSNSRYIYNASGITVLAFGQYWGYGGAPAYSKFHGPVNRRGHQSDDPTSPGFTPDCPTDGAPLPPECTHGGTDPDPEPNPNPCPPNDFCPGPTPDDPHEPRVIQPGQWFRDGDEIQSELKELYRRARTGISSPKAASYLVQAYDLVDRYSFDGHTQAIQQLEKELFFFTKTYALQGPSGTIDDHTGTTALRLYLNTLLRQGNYQKALAQSETYAHLLTNFELEAFRLSAFIGLGDYVQALAALEQLEQAQLSRHLSHPEDFTVLREDLNERLGQARTHAKSAIYEADDETEADQIPSEFALQPAYPNPFNPRAIVPFAIPKDGHVKIEAFDITGRKVATLADKRFNAGGHQIVFHADRLSSGIYIVRAVLAGHVFTRKVTLIK
ncbi:MAG: right-handed parallel beta-helix repeat-containing protein, partial [Bacteroidota bacterium]